MKSILALFLSLAFVFVAADSMADKWWYFAGENEPLYGTWINMDYSSRPPQKMVINPDGTGWASSLADATTPSWRTKSLIIAKWEDSEGNIMYKTHWVGDWREEGFSLIRISNSGKTLEFVFGRDKRPEKIDPNNINYRKYTRK